MATASAKSGISATPRWLHWWAVLTVLFALPLLTLGAEVTTKKAGMVDPKPVRPMDYLFQLIREHEGLSNVVDAMGLGAVIEHGHRTFGWAVGFLSIGLAVGLTLFQRRRWLRWAGWAALLAVSTQGVLGALRVDWNQRMSPDVGTTMALIHGCTAQLVFALLVAIALWTSASWQENRPQENVGWVESSEPTLQRENAGWVPKTPPTLRRASLVLVGVMYLQIVFGAIMRHKELALGTRIHILLAFAVVAAAVWAGVQMLQEEGAAILQKRAVWALWAFLTVQLILGLETLLSKFDVRWGFTGQQLEAMVPISELVRSIHFLVGALTFAAAVAVGLIANRNAIWILKPPITPVVPRPSQLEGAL